MISSYANELNFTMGCLAGNFSQELGDVNSTFAKSVDRVFKTAESLFIQAIADGQKDGSVDSTLDPERTGEFLLSSFEGAMVRMKSARNSEPLEAFRDLVFQTILR